MCLRKGAGARPQTPGLLWDTEGKLVIRERKTGSKGMEYESSSRIIRAEVLESHVVMFLYLFDHVCYTNSTCKTEPEMEQEHQDVVTDYAEQAQLFQGISQAIFRKNGTKSR